MKRFRRFVAVVLRMLRQNRWLLILVVLWPLGVTVLLLWPRAQPMQFEDMLPVLQQEALYGVGMVAIAASTQLGREERTRRIFEVLGRGAGRSEYIGMLAWVAWLPLVPYMLSLLLSIEVLSVMLDTHFVALGRFAVEQLVAGGVMAGAGMLFAVLLPPSFATGATLSVAALLTAAGSLGVPGPPRLLFALTDVKLKLSLGAGIVDAVTGLALGGLLCGAACWFFRRRDLRLSE